ncbi:AAA family ATPase [Alteromonas sp. ASW11-36]|uniref:AAA family ATPase n=1 Tax=Alteromonas arenosi TaxID=3055817 RepID=A0ABT7T1B4_9ALTE|nr:AAA family ATPase [Alteromonas sp. ASW11-36]MDM7862227.1 AAA family ATPase [Alteromonas sp. ASW11-36]
MKTLLLFAKYIALQEKSEKLYREQVAAAFCCLESLVIDPEKSTYKRLQVALEPMSVDVKALADKYRPALSSAVIQQMEESDVLPFSSQVNELLTKLKPMAAGDNWVRHTDLFKMPIAPVDYHAKVAQLEQLKQTLLSEVYGQDSTIEQLIDSLVKALWLPRQNSPHGLFFFAGPPASGKTFLAERLAHHLQHEYPCKSFDMTQYTNPNESFGLVGSKKTYDDSSPGVLTTFVQEHPKSIIIFDEFEKAHTQVLQSLLRMLSAGFITDEYTQKDIDFRQTIIVFTSNLGSAVYNRKDYLSNIEKHSDQLRAAMIAQLHTETKLERDKEVKAIPPELLSRLSQGSIMLFKNIGVTELQKVAKQQLRIDLEHFSLHSGIEISLPNDQLVRILLATFAPFFDLRDIKANITAKILDPIMDFVRTHPEKRPDTVKITLNADFDSLLASETCETQIRALKNRSLVFSFKHQCSFHQDVLTLTLSTPLTERLVSVEDIGGAGGIILEIPSIGFADIAGHESVKKRLQETISIIQNRSELEKAGVSAPRGMLLYGPPGTGKTMLARALANEANLPIAICSGNDLLSDSFIRDLFQRVRKYAPCILFIDEIDALPKRGDSGPIADALVNRLLIEIDGFTQTTEPIFIVAATNRPEKLDEALIRSGRLDLHVQVPYLDKSARRWFIDKFIKYEGYTGDIDVELITALTAGLSGADLEKIHREAVLQALSTSENRIDQEALVEQINILKYGSKRSAEFCRKALAETAYHEAGHAVVSKVLMPDREIEQISVVPRAQTLGMVTYNSEQKIDYTKQFWFARTCVALAGRAAQVKQFGEDGLDTGAKSDLKNAMRAAWAAIAKHGMHSESYNIDVTELKSLAGESLFREHTEKLVRQWLDDATTRTDSLISEYWGQIEATAKALLEKEVLSEAEFKAVWNQRE